MDAITLRSGSVTLKELRAIWDGAPVSLEGSAFDAIDAAQASVERIVKSGRTVYGINTGFGLLAQTRIPNERLAELQTNLILSQRCGLGNDLSRPVMRPVMAMESEERRGGEEWVSTGNARWWSYYIKKKKK